MSKSFSSRILAVKPSSTLALNARAKEMARAGAPVLNLSVGEPDFDPPQSIIDAAIQRLKQGKIKYGQAGGSIELRESICSKLERENRLKFVPDQIVVGIGAKEILFHTLMSLINPGDEVILFAPYWVSYVDQVVACEGVPVIVSAPPYTSPRLPLDELKQKLNAKTKAVVLNSPNNPADTVYSDQDLKELGALLATSDCWVISDEIYEYMVFEGQHRSLLEICPELKDRFVLINGLSKGFSMTGWRVGYGAGPVSAMKLIRSLQSHSSTCLPPFIEEAARVALEGGRQCVEAEMIHLNERRVYAIEQMNKIHQLKYYRPQGAFYVFSEIPSFEKSSEEFCERLLSQHYLALVPGTSFGVPRAFRLSYAVSSKVLEESFQRLMEGLMQEVSVRS